MRSRSRQLFLALLICIFAGPSLADALAPGIPDTPAGHALGAWIDALNSGDRAQVGSFLRAYQSKWPLDEMMQWSTQTGGYDVLEINSNDRTSVFFRVKQRSGPVEEFGRLQVSLTEPPQLTALDVRRVPTGATIEPRTLDDAARAKVIAGVARTIERFHVDPKIGRSLSTAIRQRAARGDYQSLTYGDEFAGRLTQDLREIGQDRHLEVRFSYFTESTESPARNPVSDSRLRADNCGFERAEHLRPNLGYLKFNFFGDTDICASTASAAMNFLADSDALIIDLRDNTGGMGGMATFIASYFFAERTHLSDGFRRADNITSESWTLPYVPGRKFVDKPVFVLISQRTFSAGEALAYLLKDLKRATLLGEKTVGGSGTIEFKSIDDHFTLVLPTGSVISPITRTTWAGTGVEPDVKVSAADALDVAERLAEGR